MNKRRMAMSEKKGFFKRLAQGLSKTRDNIASSFDSIFRAGRMPTAFD